MADETKNLYAVPSKVRSMENMHILFWLVKDICWCLGFRPLGVAMIFPTLIVAIWLTWKNKEVASELFHNVAIILWIIANSMWMIAEFAGVDDVVKPFCLIPFTLGILLLLFYYIGYAPLKKRRNNSKAKQLAVTPPVVIEQPETV